MIAARQLFSFVLISIATTVIIGVPYWIGMSALLLGMTYALFQFLSTTYDINFKLWFSFIGQLLGLIFVVSGFVILMMVIFNYLSQTAGY